MQIGGQYAIIIMHHWPRGMDAPVTVHVTAMQAVDRPSRSGFEPRTFRSSPSSMSSAASQPLPRSFQPWAELQRSGTINVIVFCRTQSRGIRIASFCRLHSCSHGNSLAYLKIVSYVNFDPGFLKIIIIVVVAVINNIVSLLSLNC